MGRVVQEPVKLSNNTVIPTDTTLLVSHTAMWDPAIYPNPQNFDPYRFLRLRETSDSESTNQLVSLSPTHLAFGLGKNACPGRFFAAAEVKIILCHILLKYDIKLAEGCRPKPLRAGTHLIADPTAKLVIRRRQEEVPL
jgi:cytochrome P450